MVERFRDTSGESGMADADITAQGGALLDAIEKLAPADERHRGSQTHALEVTSALARARWQLAQPNDDSLPMAFLIVLLFWFFVLFASLSAFWARNVTVVVVLLMCSLSVASAIFLIVDLNQPFEGVIQVSSRSLDNALAELGK